MRWTVRCQATFEAAHHLVEYAGGPEPVHGHSWKIEVSLGVERLGPYDLSVDFVPAEALVKELAARLHNRDLNTVPPFDRKNASAENVALWVADEIAKAGLLTGGARLEEVTVWEGARNSVAYRP
ncbi:MAG: 6-carboxytetrahydropterin synthase [Thermoanaerobaculia bacterium]|jgi:6-pyruvoyltetrahydropterin/6-carboxytetrahydropterin synthase